MAKGSATLCNLLVLFPLNYEELCATINTKMILAELPENPIHFYSKSRYNENIQNFRKNSEKKKNAEKGMSKEYKEFPNVIELDKLKPDNINKDREISQLQSEIKSIKDIIFNIQKDASKMNTTINHLKTDFQSIKLELGKKDITINQLKTNINKLESDNIKKDEKLAELKSDISSIGIKLQSSEYSHFQIQLRDIIKSFIKEVKWSFGLKSEGFDKMIDELKTILDERMENKMKIRILELKLNWKF